MPHGKMPGPVVGGAGQAQGGTVSIPLFEYKMAVYMVEPTGEGSAGAAALEDFMNRMALDLWLPIHIGFEPTASGNAIASILLRRPKQSKIMQAIQIDPALFGQPIRGGV